MTRIGCGLWLFLLIVATALGVLTALRDGGNALLGLACGAVAWLALMSGYMCILSMSDWWHDRTAPAPREGVPNWFVPVIWCVFVAASAASVWLIKSL